ncbi:MAG: HAMP domain-containing histidine kinase [Leptospiraceae bacterium]|nr:HAMP domain-containing histidine kinase [Leptospiraceae bacterium]
MVKEFAVVRNSLEKLNKSLELEVEERTSQYKKEKQKAEEANLLKDKFLSLVTHDLRSPISGVKTNIDYVLTAKNLNKEEKEAILKDNSITLDNLSSMINRLLDLNRLKTDFYKLNYRHTDLQKLVAEVFNRLSSIAKNKNIELINLVPEDTILTIDEDLFSELIYNLCHNAIKFSPPARTVKVHHYIQNGHRIIVEDSGFGMSKEQILNIWKDSYFKQTPGTNGEIGSGIGLLLCKEILKLHGGEMKVESTPHEKTLFEIRVPLNEKIIFALVSKEEFLSLTKSKDLSAMYIHCANNDELISISHNVLPDLILTEWESQLSLNILEKNVDLSMVPIIKIAEYKQKI